MVQWLRITRIAKNSPNGELRKTISVKLLRHWWISLLLLWRSWKRKSFSRSRWKSPSFVSLRVSNRDKPRPPLRREWSEKPSKWTHATLLVVNAASALPLGTGTPSPGGRGSPWAGAAACWEPGSRWWWGRPVWSRQVTTSGQPACATPPLEPQEKNTSDHVRGTQCSCWLMPKLVHAPLFNPRLFYTCRGIKYWSRCYPTGEFLQ